LPLYMILNHKTMLKEQLPSGITVRCQSKGWMTNEFTQIFWQWCGTEATDAPEKTGVCW